MGGNPASQEKEQNRNRFGRCLEVTRVGLVPVAVKHSKEAWRSDLQTRILLLLVPSTLSIDYNYLSAEISSAAIVSEPFRTDTSLVHIREFFVRTIRAFVTCLMLVLYE